jgi:DUF4097 and DUF4098 domain-containing protein YvlB
VVDVAVEVNARSGEEAERYFDEVADGIAFANRASSIQSPERDGNPSIWQRRTKVHYRVQVPHETRVEITSEIGPVEVHKIAGPLQLRAVNCPTRVEDVDGKVAMTTVNGPLHVLRCGADVEVESVNGPLTLDQVAGSAKLHATNGPLTLKLIGSHIEADVLNGPIEYDGRVGGNFALSTRNGGIVLRLPVNSRFELDAEAERGGVHSEFRVDEARVPDGEAHRIHLRTENGGIRLQRVSQ